MQLVIDGKTYDTETATLITAWDNGAGETDFWYCCEKMYRKECGEFFLCGEGGGNTRWAAAVGDGLLTNGTGILPLTENEAREWLENNVSQPQDDD